MQPTSPRRSSRARLVQPPTQVAHSNSTSSASSQRGERNTRSSIRHTSPHKAHPARSESSEEASDTMRGQTAELPPRRSRRQYEHQEEAARAAEEQDEDGAEDEGTIRCICGSQDYPGPATDGLPDAQIDFVMCDSCKVWQHGGCVGIFDEGTNPDNYFCEECKPDLHQVAKGYTGQHYSHYLPVWEIQFPKGSHRKSSVTKTTELRSKDKERSARAAAAAAAAESTKRRSTMNSRANYDEEEVLRKVLEESKNEGPPTTENGSRRGKRGREDSEDTKRDLKRQRTVSSTPSSAESDSQARETPSLRQPELKKMPSRSSMLKTRESEARGKEAERVDGTLKKKKGSDRVQSGSTPPDTTERTTVERTPPPDPPASQPPDTPSSAANLPIAKRGAKPGAAKRGGRAARGAGGHNKEPSTIEHPSPTRKGRGTTNTTSKDTSSHEGPGSGGDSTTNGTHHVGKRGRQPAVHRDPSMLELRKKAGAMAHYIRESEVEMARWTEKGLAAAVANLQERLAGADALVNMADEAISLAAELSTKLVKWETEFGKWGEKT